MLQSDSHFGGHSHRSKVAGQDTYEGELKDQLTKKQEDSVVEGPISGCNMSGSNIVVNDYNGCYYGMALQITFPSLPEMQKAVEVVPPMIRLVCKQTDKDKEEPLNGLHKRQ